MIAFQISMTVVMLCVVSIVVCVLVDDYSAGVARVAGLSIIIGALALVVSVLLLVWG